MCLVILFCLCRVSTATAQEKPVSDNQVTEIPASYISTDFVYDVESIPTVGYEKFTLNNGKLRGWRVDLSYQLHYSDQFGIVFSHGDRISVGVYQGPAVRIGRDIYTRIKRNRMNYFTYGLGIKYLWYNTERVNTGKRKEDPAYRVQSEHCFAAIPQFAIGTKRNNKRFCADFYAGLQLPVKLRDKTVYMEQNSHGTVNLNVPYNMNVTTFAIAPLVGIKLGYLGSKMKG
jgi:hypothetical protein